MFGDMAVAGVVCGKTGFGFTVVDAGSAEDHDIVAPGNLDSRGAILNWLAEEANRLVVSTEVSLVLVQRPGGGKFNPSPERTEVESAIQIGLHRAGATCDRMNREQVRAALGIPKAKGAYESLLRRSDVAARSNAQRRDQFLLALAAQV